MKKRQSAALLMGLSLLGSAVISASALAANANGSLFQIAEATAGNTPKAEAAKKTCGAGSCGSKTKKVAKKHCGHKSAKCAHKAAKCAHKAKAEPAESKK